MTTATAQSTELAPRHGFNPMEPVGDAMGLKQLLNASKNGIAEALPRHVTPERLIKTMLVAANRTPDLLKCTKASVLETINRAAELGLDLSGTLGEAYAVPFNNNVAPKGQPAQWIKQSQLIIGYRGLAKLAWQSGEIKRIEAEIVRAKDRFFYRKGTNGALEFEPSLESDRGEILGAYALVEMKSGGMQYDYMTKEQIEKVRQGSISKDSPAWRNHWEEMAKKTVFRRNAKWLPLSTEKFVAAIDHDNVDMSLDDIEISPRKSAADLNKQLGTSAPQPEVIDGSAEVLDENTGEIKSAEPQQVQQEPAKPAEASIKLNSLGEKMFNTIKQYVAEKQQLEGQAVVLAAYAWLKTNSFEYADLNDKAKRAEMNNKLME
jgi:recombination protein RecT